ncbi:MAG: LamG domain-containing protein [Candidatus Micrarchaeota archaeon]|nr:LamG domain-containing protein [Candidatus Micrarchaeota archaeon]
MAKLRAQSAMEYLMTYGWAILIVAVALAALYQLGVFNPASLQGKAQPGSCQVIRPNGPNSTQQIQVQGICNGQQPQFVASFSFPSNSYISIPNGAFPTGSSARSVFAWIYQTGGTTDYIDTFGTSGVTGEWSGLSVNGGNLYFAGWADDYSSTLAVSQNAWHFVGYTYSAGSTQVTLWLYGKSQTGSLNGGVALSTVLSGTTSGYIGGPYGCAACGFFGGRIANVQIYNSSLSSNEVQALYVSGIGGAPIRLQNLVGWWPLNSNPNDYSGDNLNGIPTNVGYSSGWSSGYTPP